MTRPTDLHVYVEAKGRSLRALGCPVVQLHFYIRPFAKLSPALSPTESSLNPPSWRTTLEAVHLCNDTADPPGLSCLGWGGTHMWTASSDSADLLCQDVPSVVGKQLDAHLPLVNFLPVMRDALSSGSGFPAASPVLLVWVVLDLCACLLAGRCSLW